MIYRQGADGGREERGLLLEIGDGLELTQNAEGQPLLRATGGGLGSGGVGPGGTPGLIMDLDPATLITTLSNNDTTGFLGDGSGSANHARQTDSAKHLTFKTNIINGFPVLESGANDYLITPELGIPTDGMTFFYVGKRVGSGVEHGTLFRLAPTATPTSDPNRLIEIWNTLDGIRWHTNHAGGNVDLSSTSATSFFKYAIRFEGASLATHFYNGVNKGTFDPSAVADSAVAFLLGTGEGSNQHARALAFNASMTDTQVGNEFAALDTKYGA